MAENFFTQFDTVMGGDTLNLLMGAPSEDILKMASVKFQEATTARMVATAVTHSFTACHTDVLVCCMTLHDSPWPGVPPVSAHEP